MSDDGRIEDGFRALLDDLCVRRSKPAQTADWGVGDDAIVGSAFRHDHDLGDALELAQQFQRQLFDAGFAWPLGPAELGGGGLDEATATQLAEIARDYEFPDLNPLLVGQQIIAPAIFAFGTDEQRRKWLPPIWRGDLVGCQLFSEPEAGSDLASVRTRATRDGNGWRVSGQKVWSSGANSSHIGELLARTDEDASKRHRGLTMFIIEMDQPGVTVRPLRQMNGSAHFCEVFLDDVVIDDSCRLGEVGQGWAVAQTSLSSERNGFGDDNGHLFLQPYDRLLQLVHRLERDDDALVRDQLATAYSREFVVRLLTERLAFHVDALGPAGPSLVKLAVTNSDWQLAQLAASLLGPSITADTGEWGHYAWAGMVLGVPAPRIAGGTNEIQRNIVAERGLGLPREPKGTTS